MGKISVKDRTRYFIDLSEVSISTYNGYTDDVLKYLKEKYPDMHYSRTNIYRVVNGTIRDSIIMDALKQVLLSQKKQKVFNPKKFTK